MDQNKDWDEFWDCDPDEMVDDDNNEVGCDIDAVNDETFGNADEWNEDEHEELIARDSILSNTAGSNNRRSNNNKNGKNVTNNNTNNSISSSNLINNVVASSHSRGNSSNHADSYDAIAPSAVWSPIAGEDFFRSEALNDSQRLQARLENMHLDQPSNSRILANQPPQQPLPAGSDLIRQRLVQKFIQDHPELQLGPLDIELLNRQFKEHELHLQMLQQQQHYAVHLQYLQHQELEQKQKQELFMRRQELQRHHQHLLQQQLQQQQFQQQQSRQQVGRNLTPSIPPAKVLTVEELERQLLADRNAQKKEQPSGYANQATEVIQQKPRDRSQPTEYALLATTSRIQQHPHQQKLQDKLQTQHHKHQQLTNLNRSSCAQSSSNRANNVTFGFRRNTWKQSLIIPPQTQLNIIEKSRRLHSITAMHDDECLQDRTPTQNGFRFRRHADALMTKKHDGVLNEREIAWLKKCQQRIQADYDNNIDQDYYYLLYSNRAECSNDGSQSWSSGPAVTDRRFVPRERLLYNIGS